MQYFIMGAEITLGGLCGLLFVGFILSFLKLLFKKQGEKMDQNNYRVNHPFNVFFNIPNPKYQPVVIEGEYEVIDNSQLDEKEGESK